jgi:hypothetical protein
VNNVTPMPEFRRYMPRFSILNLLMAMMIVALAITANGLYREVGPLRAENRRLNEERGTLVIDDPARLCAIRIPRRFAGPNRDAFRVYVPPDQEYMAFVQINRIPKAGYPKVDKLPDRAIYVGNYEKTLFARLTSGESTLVVETTRGVDRRDIVLLRGNADLDFLLDVSANTPENEWPTATPERYSVFGGGVSKQTTYADKSGRLALLRRRIQAAATSNVRRSYMRQEPKGELDGVMLWLERTRQ